jgi:hypothetical protein
MNRALPTLLVLAAAAFAAGCKAPTHMQYDHGRATMAAFIAQGDLSRPSVVNSDHPLTGEEAAAIRLNATKISSEEKTGDSELTTETE